jgi:hypothetical protein
MYRGDLDSRLTGIVPTVELHANTPLTHRSPNDVIFFQDQLNVTAGVSTLLRRTSIGIGVCVPVVGPKPYDIEAIVSLNFRF